MKTIFKKNAMALAALAIAAGSFGMMSFGKNEFDATTKVNTLQQPMYWYTQQSTNNWVLASSNPTTNPPAGIDCREDDGERCVKGFLNEVPASSINDATAADAEFYRE